MGFYAGTAEISGVEVRKKFPNLQFLSIWSETEEEQARAPSLDNINALFVACLSEGDGEAVLEEADPTAPVEPVKIAEDGLTEAQRSIRCRDSGRRQQLPRLFFHAVRSKIAMSVSARVSTSYMAFDVRQKIIEAAEGTNNTKFMTPRRVAQATAKKQPALGYTPVQ